VCVCVRGCPQRHPLSVCNSAPFCFRVIENGLLCFFITPLDTSLDHDHDLRNPTPNPKKHKTPSNQHLKNTPQNWAGGRGGGGSAALTGNSYRAIGNIRTVFASVGRTHTHTLITNDASPTPESAQRAISVCHFLYIVSSPLRSGNAPHFLIRNSRPCPRTFSS